MVSQSRTALSPDDIADIVQARCDAPHRVLGPHVSDDGKSIIIRAFLPHAQRVAVESGRRMRRTHDMRRIHEDGLFEAIVPRGGFVDYALVTFDDAGHSQRLRDPYAFTQRQFTHADEELFVGGCHPWLFDKLGAHPISHGKTRGVAFAVWAPRAQRVSVVGNFNRWDGRRHPMRRLAASGVWDLFIPGIEEGALYKFEIRTSQGAVFLKADPVAFHSEAGPNRASIVRSGDWAWAWTDARWLADRAQAGSEQAIAIRVIDVREHAAPTRDAGREPNLEELTTERFLASVRQSGYSHVELASPSSGNWSGANAFAPGHSYGMPHEFMAFIDLCHGHGLGVIVPALPLHLPQHLGDLACFDGEPLYEVTAAQEGAEAQCATDRGGVRSLLLSNAVFWLERFHVDGLRCDPRIAAWYRRYIVPEGRRWNGVKLVVREPVSENTLSKAQTDRLLAGGVDDPHSLLGPRYGPDARTLTLRALVPDAEQLCACFAAQPQMIYELQQVHTRGLFETALADIAPGSGYRLSVRDTAGRRRTFLDPYAFSDFSFSDFDLHLFGAGNHYRIYERLGAHPRSVRGVPGVGFALWAPNAKGVSVVGPFNGWDGLRHQMKRHGQSGVWELFVPELCEAEPYAYEIRARDGHIHLKADPYAFFAKVPPATASIIYRMENAHQWRDDAWMARRRASKHWAQPVAIYEVHLGSWMRGDDDAPLSYVELAETLSDYVKELGFTHIELLPVAEHPYEPSWGYQVTGYYAPTSRYGQPEDLMRFVDRCHQKGVGVILDWVAGHFPKDAHGLANFDGTCLYEHEDPRQGEHRDWGTLIFNYGRHEVENFLIANARFWLEHYHFDGLRVDAVASMLYLDYSRPNPSDWIPNPHGGRENLEAIEFLKHMNVIVHAEFPGVMMIAEESTAWPNVSRPVEIGLGFGYKWNMGWMHDVLAYMRTPAKYRVHHHSKLTFGLMYAFAENYVLALSHDEVVHMKGSLLAKMPGEQWEKFANLRLLYTFMYAHPGKKLLFMGAEFGQTSEWNHAGSLAWDLLKHEPHQRMRAFVKDLNRLYQCERALFEVDFKGQGFEWLEVDNAQESIIAFLRKEMEPRNALLFAMNFSDVSRPDHRVGVPYPGTYMQIFTSNAASYSGLNDCGTARVVKADEIPWHGREFSISIRLPALSAVVLKPAAPEPRPYVFWES